MKQEDVPQKEGISKQWHRIAYATDQQGEYVLVKSDGCDSINTSNGQAWDVIEEHIQSIHQQVSESKLSTLAYHMAMHQMDVELLSQYSSFYKWQIKRHLKPKYFKQLTIQKIQQYADIFDISVNELLSLPKYNTTPEK